MPIREALIHTNNNHWARTDYRGYWSMRYQFDSATVSKPGYIKATIRYRELPDTVFLLPESKQIGEVTVWGKNQENAGKMKGQACQEAVEAGRNAALGHTRLVGFDLGNMMDSQGDSVYRSGESSDCVPYAGRTDYIKRKYCKACKRVR